MDISGLIQSYDSRTTSSAALTRTIVAPQHVSSHPFSGATPGNMVAQHPQLHHSPFGFSSYAAGISNGLVPSFGSNYLQQRPSLPVMPSESDGSRGLSFARSGRQGFIEERHSQSPSIKTEPQWSVGTNTPPYISSSSKPTNSTPSASAASEMAFGTDVDTLMKAIQAKSQNVQPQKSSTVDQSRPVVGGSLTPPNRQTVSPSYGMPTSGEERKHRLTSEDFQDDANAGKDDKKRYQCNIGSCSKVFFQKTHLDIHERAHTGVKPYPCKDPGCGRSFSQLGNLKTHERRHTGERPYPCDICGKRFAQRGNVRAHKIVHDQTKPYLCRLDECGKQFTQLGNLKSHQNKFHAPTLRALTIEFASMKDGDKVPATKKEMFEYFATLYKYSNKGIKGRGKDRKVGSASSSSNAGLNPGMRSLGVGESGGYGMSGSGRGNMAVKVMGRRGMSGAQAVRGEGSQYEMFDVDEVSQSGSGSSGSSVETMYDDAPSDGFEDGPIAGREELAFGDRIY